MKLQTYVRVPLKSSDPKLPKDEIVLANMSIDASSFLPRGYASHDDSPKWIMAFIRRTLLNDSNRIKLVNDEPEVTINRKVKFNMKDPVIQKLKELTDESMKVMEKVLGLDFIIDPEPPGKDYFGTLQLGGVAHELGTIPMKGNPKRRDGTANTDPYFVDEKLKLCDYEGVYVCDLSVFPVSPEVNPTLTLTALALRLSRESLMPRLNIITNDGNSLNPDNGNLDLATVYVVNHSGKPIKVWVSNRATVSTSNEENNVILGPGAYQVWKRKKSTMESISVFRLKYNSQNAFVDMPELVVGRTGEITAIL